MKLYCLFSFQGLTLLYKSIKSAFFDLKSISARYSLCNICALGPCSFSGLVELLVIMYFCLLFPFSLLVVDPVEQCWKSIQPDMLVEWKKPGLFVG